MLHALARYKQTRIADTISIKNVCLVKLILFKKASYRTQCCPVKAETLSLMTQIRMRIRVCQRNMKAQQDCKQVMERAARKRLRRFLKRKM